MKGLLILLGLVVVAILYTMANFSVVASPILANIAQQEGTVDAMQDAAQQDGFAAKYRPFFDKRYWLGRIAVVMDDDTFLRVSGDTVDRYSGSPLDTDPEYGYLIIHRAELLDDRNQFHDAGVLFVQYEDLFPQGGDLQVAKSALVGLRINHGF